MVNLVEHGETSAEIFAKLEPYKVKRAVFLAAGLGSRLTPITINTPKPLVRVHGKRIIDTLIDACLENGIDEIYVVTGYLAEEFTILQHKYPMIKLIHNADFNKANNISSAVVSCHLFENAYVFEADLLVKNPQIIRKYHYCSDVLGIWMDESTDWCLMPDGDGYVAEETVGGKNCYQMVGIYYWNKEDAKRLRKDLQETFEKVPGGRNRYWETVPNQLHQGEYKIKIVPCSKTDVIEIDTYEELKQIDSSYT
ncbi:phosphocholine cytidylyltransferase family protein [Candidatus Saccharibacteria bacterium]|nr:phosphocholine cytidylyltransferase family protein [Candidatus Saccharibacteria bacterium]